MALTGGPKGKGKATARAKMLTAVINQQLSLNQDRIKIFNLKHICGRIRMINVSGIKEERA